jgi:hypothetical protein
MNNSDKRKYMDDVFFSTSPVEKGLIFRDIDVNINKIIFEGKIQDFYKKHNKIIDDLHSKYIREIYNIVLLELRVYKKIKKIKYESMLWNNFINSI